MNVRDAAYHLVHDYPGGADALGPRLGKRGSSLSAEVSMHPVTNADGRPTAKLGVADAMKAMHMSGDHRLLHAMSAELGYLNVPLPPMPGDEDDADGAAAAQRMGELAREFAEVMGAAVTTMADGRVSDNELARVEAEWGQLVARGQQLLELFVRINAAQRPGGAHGTPAR